MSDKTITFPTVSNPARKDGLANAVDAARVALADARVLLILTEPESEDYAENVVSTDILSATREHNFRLVRISCVMDELKRIYEHISGKQG